MTGEQHRIIIKARTFACNLHRECNKLYDNMPYHVHLLNVINAIEKFKHLIHEDKLYIAIASAWCHDTLEDCGITYNDLVKETTIEIADVAYLLSNNKGKTRQERANDDYYVGIKSNDIALFCKLCDRIGNLTHGIIYGKDGSSMVKKYKDEMPHFKEHLYNGLYDEMWDYLENINVETVQKDYFFPDVEKFDDRTIHQINLPKIIPFALYNELYEKGIIRKSELKKNTYYKGKCRNAEIALWNGFEFVYMRYKFGCSYPETIKSIEDDDGFDLFIPLYEVSRDELNENQIIKF